MEGQVLVSGAALAVAILSAYFSIKSWRQANRPLVTVRISSLDMAGNVSTPLSILVENTGNRPAKNIRLDIPFEELKEILREDVGNPLRKAIERCFSPEGLIPVLANGRFVSNSFGFFSTDSDGTWTKEGRFTVVVSYEDLDGRKFRHSMPIFIENDIGFAGANWSKPKDAKLSL